MTQAIKKQKTNDFSAEEIDQLVAKLPLSTADLEGVNSVLELSTGTNARFTKPLSSKFSNLKSYKAYETNRNVFEECQSQFTDSNVIEYQFLEIKDLGSKFPSSAEEFDLIVVNWTLMFLSDSELPALMKTLLTSLTSRGRILVRESCFSEDNFAPPCTVNPIFRHPQIYVGAFESCHFFDADKKQLHTFELISSSMVSVFRTEKQQNGQICFSYQKASKPCTEEEAPTDTFHQFLDKQQYSVQSITRYEKIFGNGYVSTGGPTTTHELVPLLNLQPGQHVLDVGCGIGGGNFYMAKEFKVKVTAIDLSSNMIHVAFERSTADPELNVEFELCDATTKEYPQESFDVVYSRDTILHIPDKKALFARFFKWLKPGGRVLISDYCCAEAGQETTQAFKDYVKSRGYTLVSPKEYGKILESVGFEDVEAQDRTEQFHQILVDELAKTEKMKDKFIAETSEEDYQAIIDGWSSKIERVGKGDQRWGVFLATKPAQ